MVEFKLISKNDSRIYLKGSVDFDGEMLDEGEWEYEQNNGLFDSHIPSYWKVDGENLSDEFEVFLGEIDWEMFRQYLYDFKDENKTVDFFGNQLIINDGAKMECEIVEHPKIDSYMVELIPKFNGEKIDLTTYMKETSTDFDPWYVDDGTDYIEDGKIFFEMSSDYWEDSDSAQDRLEDVNEEARSIYAMVLTKELGIYSKYGEVMEQLMDNYYDNEWLFKMSQMVNKSDEELDAFLREEGLINKE